MTVNTITASTGISITKSMAAFLSTVNAITIAPNTTKGERRSSLRPMLMPWDTEFASTDMRFMSCAVPVLSSCRYERDWMWLNRSFLMSPVAIAAAFAEKYWAISVQLKPIRERASRMRKDLTRRPLSPEGMLSSTIRITT